MDNWKYASVVLNFNVSLIGPFITQLKFAILVMVSKSSRSYAHEISVWKSGTQFLQAVYIALLLQAYN